MKYGSQAMTVIASSGLPTGEAHLDGMAKVPYYKMARDKSKPPSFTNVRADGQPALVEQSHSFPLSDRCLLCTSGVVICNSPASAVVFDDGHKPQFVMPKPAAADFFVRPYKFMEDDALGHMEDLFASAHTRPQLRNACAVKLGFDNGPGYAVTELKNQHLMWRLARDLQWHYLLCQAPAPDNSSTHWQAESVWSIIRRGLCGKALGWSWCTGDPVDQPLPVAEIEKRTASSAMKEYHQLLLNIAADGAHDWHVVARQPPPLDLRDDAWVKDGALLEEYYQLTREDQVRQEKYAAIRAESLDVGRHIVTKTPSHLEFRCCMSANACELCVLGFEKRRKEFPHFTMEALLAPLAFNGHRLPHPAYYEGKAPAPSPPPENASARAPTPSEGRDWAARVEWVQPRSEVSFGARKGGPYMSLKEAMDLGQQQHEANIPVSTVGVERLILCDFSQSCRYCAKSLRELSRHKLFHHDAVAPPAVAALPPHGPPLLAGDMEYDLGPCEPRPRPPPKKRDRDGVGGKCLDRPGCALAPAEEAGSDVEDAGSVGSLDKDDPVWVGFRAAGVGCSDSDGDAAPPEDPKPSKRLKPDPSNPLGASAPGPWRGPAMKGGWDVVEVPGGWIRFNLEQRRLDAHCANPNHGGPGKCKMDRVAKKGPLGGELLWLALSASPETPEKSDHDKLKDSVSEPGRRGDRAAKRAWLEAKAVAEGGKYRKLLDVEMAARGTVAEP